MSSLIYHFLFGYVVHNCLGWKIEDEPKFVVLSETMEKVLTRLGNVEVDNADLLNENKWMKNMLLKLSLQLGAKTDTIRHLEENLLKTGIRLSEVENSCIRKSSADEMFNGEEVVEVRTKERKTNFWTNVGKDVHTNEGESSEKLRRLATMNPNAPKIRRLLLPAQSPTPTHAPVRTKVAFSARVAKPALTGIGIGHPIVFDHVDVNLGGDYDKALGAFVCRVPGYYFFTMTLTSSPGHEANVDIVLDGTVLGIAYAGDDGAGHGARNWETGSTSVVTHCNKGQHVWTKLHTIGDQLYGDYHSGFEGFILWADSE